MTTWEEIETLAMTYIKNDITLDYDLQNRLPVFYNRMSAYMKTAIPKFNKPPAMLIRLSKYTAPNFSDVIETVSEEQASPAVIHTELTGFDICSAGLMGVDSIGDPTYTPVSVLSYDTETGDVTLNTALNVGDTICIDFYSSGYWDIDLNDTEKDILAFCIYDVWEKRFDNDALERMSKIRDGSFSTISEASQTMAATGRQTLVDEQLFDMLRAYEVNCEYMKVVEKYPLF